MSACTPEQIEAIFAAALACTESDRSAFVAQACTTDAQRRRVEALLAAHSRAGQNGFLGAPTMPDDQPPAGAPEPDTESANANSQIGPYRLLQRIGEGGFGEVWEAEQREPVRRRVALKIVKAGMDSSEILARFEAERQALALMDHPNVAKVFDAGATPAVAGVGGRPFVVMEHVPGLPITDYCDAARLPIRRRLELFIPVCHAVQHAHTKGIIHRDLKPSNILVTLIDGEPVPKVIDFGIAKATAGAGAPLTDRTLFTRIGRLMGTPEYMSPEQAGGGMIAPASGSSGNGTPRVGGLDIDTRSDIYSLGVILYQLLTGTLPFDPKRLQETDLAGLARIIRELEPDKPSTRLSTLSTDPVTQHSGATPQDISARRATDYPALQRQLRGELDWIVMKCLEKDRTRRYETANGLAMDVQRHLSGEPVVAAPPSRAYRFRKLLRRYRTPAVVAGGFVLLLLATTAVSVAFWRRAEANADATTRQMEETELSVTMLAEMIGPTNVDGIHVPNEAMLQRLDAFAATFESKLKGHPNVEARVRLALGNAYRALGKPARAEPHLARALAIYRELVGPQHPRLATAIHDWAWLLHDKGDIAGAMTFAQEALAMRRRLLGDRHLDVTYSLDQVGEFLWHLGKLPESEAAHRASLATLEGLYGPEDREETGTLEYLFQTLYSAGRTEDAEAIALRSLALNRKIFGEGSPRAAAALTNLARATEARLDHIGAERLYTEALEIERAHKNDAPAAALGGLAKFADFLMRRGRPDEAELLCREALTLAREHALDDTHVTADILGKLAGLQHRQHDLAGAVRYARDSIDIYRRTTAPNPNGCRGAAVVLALALTDEGKLQEAELVRREFIEYCRRHFPQAEAVLASELGPLGIFLLEQGRYAEAEPPLRECLSIRERIFGARPDAYGLVANTRRLLAAALVGQGRLEAADPLMHDGIKPEISPGLVPWLPFVSISVLGGTLVERAAALTDTDRQRAVELLIEAEPLLLEGFQRLTQDEEIMGSSGGVGAALSVQRRDKSGERVVRLYEVWDAVEPGHGYADEAAEWRQKLETASTPPNVSKPGPSPP